MIKRHQTGNFELKLDSEMAGPTGAETGIATGTKTGIATGTKTGIETGTETGIATEAETGIATGIATEAETEASAPTGTEKYPLNSKRAARWAAASGFCGAIAEYYDFALYAPAAALFFGPLFFTPLGTAGAYLAALASFSVAYLARPIGALIFGQFGDRRGRQKTLFFTLLLMGGSTTAIGLLPTYTQAGWLGPILLVGCRILQGLSAGIEQAGSGTISAEHAPHQRRGLYTSWTMIGVSLGWFAGPAILTPLSENMTWLLAGGWRYPFLLALPLVAVALWVRAQVPEPKRKDLLTSQEKAGGEPRTHSLKVALNNEGNATPSSPATPPSSPAIPPSSPLGILLRHYPGQLLRVIGCSLHMLVGVTFNVFVLGYATGELGLDRASVLGAISLAGISTAFLQPVWAWVSDCWGRKIVFIGSCLGLAAGLPVVFWALQTRQFWCYATVMIGFYVIVMAGNVVQASFYPEMFPATVRLTGVSVGTQVGLVLVGLSPIGYQLLTTWSGGSYWPGCLLAATAWLVAAGCAAGATETSPSLIRQQKK